MAINVVSVQDNGGLLPDIVLLTQCYYHHRLVAFLYLQPNRWYVTAVYITTMFDGVLHCFGFVFTIFWCPCVAINVSVQYNGGLLPDIILLTQCSYHRGTRFNTMEKFCICSL